MLPVIRFSGLELRFVQSRESTEGSLDAFEMIVQPNARMPVPHHHETWDETIYGLRGTTVWHLDGTDHHVGPGQSIFIRRGVVHGFGNATSEPATCLCILTPGILGPGYFEEMAALAAVGVPDPAKMKAVMLRHGLVPASPA